jgi:rRNA maturation endonuclease Nob1
MNDTLCWRCSREYDPRHAECPHCGAANANHDLEKAQAEMGMREETVYEKSARWAWPDGRPDL